MAPPVRSYRLTHRSILVILIALSLAACGRGDGAPPGAAGGPPTLEVEVLAVTPSPVSRTSELPGRVQAIRSAQVRARVEGVITAQRFTDGSEVRAGAPLYEIDPRVYEASLASALAELAAAQATFARYESLLGTKAVSVQEADTARARLKAAEASAAKARLDLENARPTAPISGRAGRSLVTEGALVGKGEATHLVTIEQLDPVRVEFTQPYAELRALQARLADGKQQAVKEPKIVLLFEDGSPYAHPGQLKFRDLAVDPATGNVTLRAEFPNPQRQLLPGTFVRVRIPISEQADALRIPQRAVSTGVQGQSVMVVDGAGSVAVRRIVTTGMEGGDFIVTDGLQAGDQVIVNGLQKAKPGATVKPVPWTPTPAPH